MFHRKQNCFSDVIPDLQLNGLLVIRVYHAKFLVLIDSNLSLDVQTQNVLNKISKYIYVMCRTPHVISLKKVLMVYNGLLYLNR